MQFRLHALPRFAAQLVSVFRPKVRFPEIAAVLPPSQIAVVSWLKNSFYPLIDRECL